MFTPFNPQDKSPVCLCANSSLPKGETQTNMRTHEYYISQDAHVSITVRLWC